jgi:cyclophilin family peptidyl-prolyl cis-trans isomerase
MSPRKKVSKEEAQRTERTIQYVAAVMIVIVVAIVTWPYVAKLFPKAEATTSGVVEDVESETACAVFDSIPVAAQYDEVPPTLIDTAKQYFARFKMAKGGEFVVELYPSKAPITVNSFVFLACKDYFDGVTFHRVLEGFMAQGGDPTGTGSGGPGYQFVNEDSDLVFDKKGVVAMANAGRDTNGSQFFITFGPQEMLNGDYTIFGQVVEGMEVVNGVTRREPRTDTFMGDAIETIVVTVK